MGLRSSLASRPTRWAFGAATLVALLLLPSRLLGVHGVESALVLGVVLSPFVAAAGAGLVLTARRRRVHWSAASLMARATGLALGVLAIPLLLLALNQLRVRQCAPLEALSFMSLGPGFGFVLAAWTGAAVAAALPRWPRLSVLVAVLVPLAAHAAGVHRFWSTPAISVLSHFAGWFPGTIYDEDVSVPLTLITFRLVTLGWLGTLAALLAGAWDPGTATLRLLRARSRPVTVVCAILLGAGSTVAFVRGPDLGHRTTAAHLASELGVTSRGTRCTVHAPRELDRAELDRLVRDCDFRVEQAESAMGVEQDEPVVAFLFRSAAEKQALMGAGGTNIAKPWRREVYLQLRGWPHPILAHEVAHVVAGRAAEGPWLISGWLGGWLPNPGLVEGMAVAVAWNEHEGMTPHQWARAILELERLPPLDRVFGLSFMVQPARHAYTAAGSFVRFLASEHGKGAVREAYRTGSVERATGRPLPELELAWRSFLQEQPLPPDGLALARIRFSGRSIFSMVCPHRMAALRRQLGEDRRAGDFDRVRQTCNEILDIDPADVGTRGAQIAALARTGHVERAEEAAGALRDEHGAPEPVVVAALEAVADAAWLRGEVDRPLRLYRDLLSRPQTDASARSLEVKVLALEAGGRQAALVRDLLVPADGRGVAAAVAVHLAREIGALRQDGLGAYLEARQLHYQGRYDLALPLLRQASALGLPTDRLREENARLLGISLYATAQWEEAVRHWRTFERSRSEGAPGRLLARDWLARLEHARTAEHARARPR